jgi:hypothetical protein
VVTARDEKHAKNHSEPEHDGLHARSDKGPEKAWGWHMKHDESSIDMRGEWKNLGNSLLNSWEPSTHAAERCGSGAADSWSDGGA